MTTSPSRRLSRCSAIGAACLLLALSLAPARANLLTNGNFENPGATLTTGNVNVAGTSNLTGWTATAGNGSNPGVYYAANGGAGWIPDAQSGSYCVQLDSTSTSASWTAGSSISQTFNISQAGTYQLSFWINTEVGTGKGGTSAVDVTLSNSGLLGLGILQNTVLNGVKYTVTNSADVTRGDALWQNYTVNFTVNSNQLSNYKLTFADDPSSGNSNVSVDNVSVELVPEFSHWAVFAGFGILIVGAGRRRRRRVMVGS